MVTGGIAVLFSFVTAKSITKRLTRFSAIAERWSKGDLSDFICDEKQDEVGELARRLDEMAKQLYLLLQEREEVAVTEERNRMARELHDSVKQLSLAASFQISTALSVIENDPETAGNHMREAENILDMVRRELTSLIEQVYPGRGERKNFVNDIEKYIKHWSKLHAVSADIHLKIKNTGLKEINNTLFRIIQEALANVARHSFAQHVIVSLIAEKDHVYLAVEDDGRGFDTRSGINGMGIRSMEGRTESFGGVFTVESEVGRGVRIAVRIPTR